MEWTKTILDLLTSLLALIAQMNPSARRKQAALRKYCGNYQGYHLSTARNGVVVADCLMINARRFGRLDIRMVSFGYKYTGELEVADTNVYLSLIGDGHKEQILAIFNEPLTPTFDLLLGVFSAVTETRLPACGKMLFRRIATTPNCERIQPAQCDTKILTFLRSPDNPIVVPKMDRPVYEELP